MKTKLSQYLKLFMCSILFTSIICASNNKEVKAVENLSSNNSSEELVVSMYATDETSSIVKVNPISKEQSELVSNQSVWLSGNLSEDKNSLVYMNALGEEPWQVFSLNLKNNKTSKLTTDKVGKVNSKAGKDNIIYFEMFDRYSGCTKIEKLNTKDNSSLVLDSSDKDRDLQVYDVKNDKVIAVMFSQSEDDNRYKEANNAHTPVKPIAYSIYEMNIEGSNMKKITSVNAKIVNSISYNYDCTKVIISGENINNENGNGIYEVSTENGQITKLLTDAMILGDKNSILSEIRHSNGVLSKDGNLLYFAGKSKNAEELKFQDITAKPQDIYSYNLITHEIKEVYASNKHTIITDLTISY